MARDSYSYLHFPMIAGIILVALGMKKTLGDTGEPLKLVTAAALLGGTAAYLLAHVAFRWRNVHTLNRQRLLLALALLALIPLATEVDSLIAVAGTRRAPRGADRLRDPHATARRANASATRARSRPRAERLAPAVVAVHLDHRQGVAGIECVARRRKEGAFLWRAATAVAGDVKPLLDGLRALQLRIRLRQLAR